MTDAFIPFIPCSKEEVLFALTTGTADKVARISLHEFMDTDFEACLNGTAPLEGNYRVPSKILPLRESGMELGFVGYYSVWFRKRDVERVKEIIKDLGFYVWIDDCVEQSRAFRRQHSQYYLKRYGSLEKPKPEARR